MNLEVKALDELPVAKSLAKKGYTGIWATNINGGRVVMHEFAHKNAEVWAYGPGIKVFLTQFECFTWK